MDIYNPDKFQYQNSLNCGKFWVFTSVSSNTKIHGKNLWKITGKTATHRSRLEHVCLHLSA